MRKIKKAIQSIMLTVLMLSLCACSSGGLISNSIDSTSTSSDDLPTIRWKMTSPWAEGNMHYTVDQRFTELVSQLTGGKFIIDNYSEGKLCQGNQVFDMVKDGVVEMSSDWPGYWSGKNTAFDLLGTSMDNMTGLDMYVWTYEGGGLKEYQDLYGQYGLVYYPFHTLFAESGIRSNKPIESIDDMKNMKIRISGKLQGLVAEKIGFVPVTVGANEIYESLQRGVIDAAEFSTPGPDEVLKLQEVTKYWTTPGWHQTCGINGIMINEEAWNSLPEEYQLAIETAARLTNSEQLSRYLWTDMKATETFIESGVEITKLPEEDLELISQYVDEATQEMCEENPDYEKIVKSINSYRETADPYRDILGKYGYGFTK